MSGSNEIVELFTGKLLHLVIDGATNEDREEGILFGHLLAESLEETDDLCQRKQLFLSIVVTDDSFVLDEMLEIGIGVWTRVLPGTLLKDAGRPVAEQFEAIKNDVCGKGTHRGTEFSGTLSLEREFDLFFFPCLRSFCCRMKG